MAGVTKDEVLDSLAKIRGVLWPLPVGGTSAPAFRETVRIQDRIKADGLDPGPHPSLEAIEGRLEESIKLLVVGCWDTGRARLRGLLDDIRSGKIPPGPTEAEAEKLRAEKDSLLQQASVAEEQAERLRAELADLLDRNGEQAKALDVARREVAALQDRNGRQYETIKGQDAEIGVLRAEVERLRRTVETGIIRRPTWKIDLSETTGAVAALADGVTRLVGRLERFESEVARLNEINDRADRIPAGA